MADLLNIGISALLSQQRALATISNNISNVNTPGYSRQRVELSARTPERAGDDFLGTGVTPTRILRITDDILVDQLRTATSSFSRASSFTALAEQIDNLFADDQLGLNATLQNLVNAVQDVADQPASIPARQVLISEGRNLAGRFDVLQGRLDEIGGEVTTRMTALITEINALAGTLAEVNREIFTSSVGGVAPAALLDQKDQLLSRLSEIVSVNAITRQDGTADVFIGSGQALVLGNEASNLTVARSNFDPQSAEVILQGNGTNVRVTDLIGGGELGGILDFRRELLSVARANLGLIAAGVVETFNSIHREGIDLFGQLGTDFFGIGSPAVFQGVTNSGTGSATVTIANVSNLEPTTYLLSYDGASYQLTRTDNGSVVAMTGTGAAGDPFLADGLSIVVSGAPAASDQILLDPLSKIAGAISVLIQSADRIAAAAPTRTNVSLNNQGTASISPGEVADITDPGLMSTTTIAFLTPTTYSVNGAGSFAYTSGADIVLNGTRVQITGVPALGDQFVIQPNTAGIGDNRNALRLAGISDLRTLNGGATSLRDSIGQMVTTIGAQVSENSSRRDAQGALLGHARASLESIRGVNLDEEAADLLRFQQAYQAATQTISIAQTLFDSVLAAVRR